MATLTNLNYCPILLVSSHFHSNQGAPQQLAADVTYSLEYKTLTNLNYFRILLVSSHFCENGCKEHRSSWQLM
ncbi:hypothetical protein J6590_098050 [Homalodisca vitripennis]|nr:hypothetical protein J6590_098050 [Homalodisca vitripennis]